MDPNWEMLTITLSAILSRLGDTCIQDRSPRLPMWIQLGPNPEHFDDNDIFSVQLPLNTHKNTL